MKHLVCGDIEGLRIAVRTAPPRSGKRRKGALKDLRDFKNNAPYMRNAQFRRDGLFVSAGVVEAARKTRIGRRLKQSGMFWSLRGANAIIAARCCHFSRRTEQFWEDRAAEPDDFVVHSLPVVIQVTRSGRSGVTDLAVGLGGLDEQRFESGVVGLAFHFGLLALELLDAVQQ